MDQSQMQDEFDRCCKVILQEALELEKEADPSRVSSAILYAAARYNAFHAVHADLDISKNKDKAISYFIEQYAAMLKENFDVALSRHSNKDR